MVNIADLMATEYAQINKKENVSMAVWGGTASLEAITEYLDLSGSYASVLKSTSDTLQLETIL